MDKFIADLEAWLREQCAFASYTDPRDALDATAGHGRGQLAPDGC